MVKVDRSYPAPESLTTESAKAGGSYNKPDVIDRLKSDFNDKCYLCELKNLQDTEVEHLLPHENGKYPERKFDWDNLFWCCGHCNKVKNQKKYNNGIIDCCKDDPEEYLTFSLEQDNVLVQIIESKENLPYIVVTAKLLDEIYNLKNTGIREAACNNRFIALLENIVIRPTEPVYCELISAALSMKVVSNKYLLKNDG